MPVVKASVEEIGDFCNPNPVQNFHWVIRSELNLIHLSKYSIQSGLYPKKLWLSISLQWLIQFRYPYRIRLSFFRNPVRSGSGSELQNPVGSRSGNRVMFNTGRGFSDTIVQCFACHLISVFGFDLLHRRKCTITHCWLTVRSSLQSLTPLWLHNFINLARGPPWEVRV